MAVSDKAQYTSLAIEEKAGVAVVPTKSIAYVSSNLDKEIKKVKSESRQNVLNNTISIAEGTPEIKGGVKLELDPKDSAVWFLLAMGKIETVKVSNGIYRHKISDKVCQYKTLTLESKKGGCSTEAGLQEDVIVTRAYGSVLESLKLSVAPNSMVKLDAGMAAMGAFDVAFLQAIDGGVYFFDNRSVAGIVAGDTVKISNAEGDFEDVVVDVVDEDNDSLTFTTAPDAAKFTVEKDVKVELVAKTHAMTKSQFFAYGSVKIRVGATVAEARTGAALDVEKLDLELKKNVAKKTQTRTNSVVPTGLDATISHEASFENKQLRDEWRKGKKMAMVVEFDTGVKIVAGQPETHKVVIILPKVAYETIKLNDGKGALISEKCVGLAMHDFDTASSVQIEYTNDVDGTYYAS